jgi:hypothetical protein
VQIENKIVDKKIVSITLGKLKQKNGGAGGGVPPPAYLKCLPKYLSKPF